MENLQKLELIKKIAAEAYEFAPNLNSAAARAFKRIATYAEEILQTERTKNEN